MRLRFLSVILTVLLIISVSVVSISAITLYEENGYTYADIGNGNVALYAFDNSSSTLTVKAMYNNKQIYSIYRYAFQNNDTIETIDFSHAYLLREIGNNAFLNCQELYGNLVLPNTLNTLGIGAFQGCTGISSATIANVAVIPQQCFYGDSQLYTVNLPVNLKRIEKLAFGNCDIGRIFIPQSVEYIDSTAFSNCRNLVIECYKDSYALQYAEENQIDHIILDGDKTGDVNGDGVVDILDATEIQKYAAESTDFTEEQFELGDINKDGYCDVIDALLVQKSVIGAYELPQNIIRY